MKTTYLPTTREIRDLFQEEITKLDGTLRDTYDDGRRLFLRAVLARSADVLPGDQLNAGVALRAAEDEILVHPYTFRQVCKNGAIIAHALQTRRIERAEFSASSEAIAEVEFELREAVRACSSGEVFSRSVGEMRSTTDVDADLFLQLMPSISGVSARVAAQLLRFISERFHSGRDRSMFGLVNAVTSVARDTRDPEIRWRLEELGGGIPARLTPQPKPAPAHAELTTA